MPAVTPAGQVHHGDRSGLDVRCVRHEQPRGVGVRIADDRQQVSLILRAGTRRRDRDGLARQSAVADEPDLPATVMRWYFTTRNVAVHTPYLVLLCAGPGQVGAYLLEWP